ncbi:Zinc finger protein [Dirofilaria immitis]
MIRFGKLVDGAIYELNRRSGLLYYHNGKIEPPYIWNYLNQHFQNNSTNHNHQKWSPYRAVLFGNEDPLNITGMIGRGELITSKIKLAIIITSDSGRTKAYERASMTAQSLRWTTSNMYMPICIVAQSDTRKEKETISTSDRDNVILIFHGSDVKASTFIVDTRDEEILKTKLLKWKKKLSFFNSHQIFAFHFTVINGVEPENSEEIFKRFGKLVDGAIYELNRRSGLLYYHNGKIEPPYIWNYLNQHFQNNSTNHNHQKWSPYRAVLFGNEDPLNITGMIGRGELITSKIKLAIIITSDSGRTKAYERASMTAQSLRWTTSNMYMPICIVAQSDTRKEKETISTSDRDNVILIFHGSDVKASTFIVDTRDEEILKTKLLKWKKKLSFFNSHQIFAFHFTVINGVEPENSEEIFKNIFENVHLSTLRLLDEQSITGINHQDNDKYNFDNGPVYAIIGLKKWIKDEKKYL